MPISLDPCSNSGSIVPAAVRVSLPCDGLAVDWYRYGHTFVNPPYWALAVWLAKCAAESRRGAHTITLLIPASPETSAFREHVFGAAQAIAFWKKRIGFLRDGERAGNTLPSALVYYGPEEARFSEHFRGVATVVNKWI